MTTINEPFFVRFVEQLNPTFRRVRRLVTCRQVLRGLGAARLARAMVLLICHLCFAVLLGTFVEGYHQVVFQTPVTLF